jgi:hypothetical protein
VAAQRRGGTDYARPWRPVQILDVVVNMAKSPGCMIDLQTVSYTHLRLQYSKQLRSPARYHQQGTNEIFCQFIPVGEVL